MKILAALAFASILFVSCTQTKELPKPVFADYYRSLRAMPSAPLKAVAAGQKLTFSAQKVPLIQFARMLADKAGVSIIVGQDLDKGEVSLEVRDADVDEIIGGLARRLESRATRIGNIWFLGKISPEDRGILVRSVRRLTGDELGNVCKLFASEFGRQATFADGLVVIADRVEVLQRLNQALDQVENTPTSCWVAQMFIVSIGDKLSVNLGMDLTNAVTVAATVHGAALHPSANGMLTALLSSALNSSGSRVIAAPLLLIRDGSTSTITIGDDIPVPKKTVSNFGTVETVGFDLIKAGFSLTVGVRELTLKGCEGHFKLDLSQVTGAVENIPIVNRQALETKCYLESGGVYLLGSLTESQHASGIGGAVVPLTYTLADSNTTVQLWTKVYRIGSAFLDERAAGPSADGHGAAGTDAVGPPAPVGGSAAVARPVAEPAVAPVPRLNPGSVYLGLKPGPLPSK